MPDHYNSLHSDIIELVFFFVWTQSLPFVEVKPSCIAPTKSNATNFCLCYFKSAFPAATRAATLDGGHRPRDADPAARSWGTDPAEHEVASPAPPQLPKDPAQSLKAPGSGPNPTISHRSPRSEKPNGSALLSHSPVLLSPRSSRLPLAADNLINTFNYQQKIFLVISKATEILFLTCVVDF